MPCNPQTLEDYPTSWTVKLFINVDQQRPHSSIQMFKWYWFPRSLVYVMKKALATWSFLRQKMLTMVEIRTFDYILHHQKAKPLNKPQNEIVLKWKLWKSTLSSKVFYYKKNWLHHLKVNYFISWLQVFLYFFRKPYYSSFEYIKMKQWSRYLQIQSSLLIS